MNVQFQLIANGLMLLSSVLFIAVPQFYYTVFFGRFIAGVATGLGYVAVENFTFSNAKVRFKFPSLSANSTLWRNHN